MQLFDQTAQGFQEMHKNPNSLAAQINERKNESKTIFSLSLALTKEYFEIELFHKKSGKKHLILKI